MKYFRSLIALTLIIFGLTCAEQNYAATFIVTKIADTSDGTCDSDCSLREAVAAANAAVTDDIINFDPIVFAATQTITLSGSQIFIDQLGALAINGTGISLLRISGANTSRIFLIAPDALVSIHNLTLRDGREQAGGAVFSFGTLNLTNTLVTANAAFDGDGGGIKNNEGVLNLENSTVSFNTATAGGGGIANFKTLTLNNSTINNNTASIGAGVHSGGINNSGTLTVTNSLINSNAAGSTGGGIRLIGGVNNTFTNSTITGNRASQNGGGFETLAGITLNLSNATVNNNSADSGSGGGIYNSGTLNSRNTIIGDNSATNGTAPDVLGNFNSQGYNLVENVTGTTISGITTGNILGQDPQLLPLRSNGGATQTIGLHSTSPAVDAADPANFPATDQRGIARPRDGDLNGTTLPDIGAYERQFVFYTVTKTTDTNDGNCDADCSLREAIAAANIAATPDNAVIFDPTVFATTQTITLTLGELQINNAAALTLVNGTGMNSLIVSGNNQSRAFFVNNGCVAGIQNLTVSNGAAVVGLGVGGGILNNGSLSVNNLVIKDSTVNNYGGGIFNNGSGGLIVKNSVIRNNSSPFQGGGIGNFMGGAVEISYSTISGNSATNNGGGIYNGGGMTLINTTVSGNTSNANGGGIYNVGLFAGLTLTHVTLARNTAQGSGGGVYAAAQVAAKNTIIGANESLGTNSEDFDGNLFSYGYNLIQNTTNTIFSGTTSGNILHQDPQLSPLGDNGGSTPTQGCKPTSPAIDAGNSFGIQDDQRKRPRPIDFPFVPTEPGSDTADIGAFERQIDDIGGSVVFDFDGDAKTDISIFRPSVGEWWYLKSSDGGNAALQFGNSSDRIAPADFTGDGRTDIAFFRPSTGEWFVLRSEDLSFYSFPFGSSGDIAAPGDFDGDGKADAAVFRPSSATWFISRSSGGTTIQQFGLNGDAPVVSDYDGDGKADIAIFRPSVGEWWVQPSGGATTYALQFGSSADKPVQGDFTGDGKSDIAFWRPSTGEWFILRSENFSYYSFPFGTLGDIPTPGDYDGDGKSDASIFRPSTSTWYIERSTAGTLIQTFGQTGDLPVPNAFVR